MQPALFYQVHVIDLSTLCRVYLDQLQSPDDAVRVVKESGSTEGANMVARYIIIHTMHVHVCRRHTCTPQIFPKDG